MTYFTKSSILKQDVHVSLFCFHITLEQLQVNSRVFIGIKKVEM